MDLIEILDNGEKKQHHGNFFLALFGKWSHSGTEKVKRENSRFDSGSERVKSCNHIV